ncbi:MAG: hypothetical protein Q8Q49_05415 [bacterium]|nr:hypothetical protein [bacterium]
MKKSFFVLSILLVIIVVLTITRAVVSNSLATSGVDLNKLSAEVDSYQRESALLEEKILNESSFTNLKEEAGRQGYETMSSQIVLSAPLPMAYNK